MIAFIILVVGFVISFYKPIKHGLYDGWNGTHVYKHLYYKDDPIKEIPYEIEEEIIMLEMVIERRKQAAHILELELDRTTDTKKRITILTKLNTMDKQTHNDVKKLNKLKDGY